MNLFNIALKNTFHKPLNAVLSIVLVAFSVGLIAVLQYAYNQITQKFQTNIAGIDMVVGAKGSPLQLVLSALFQVDAPTGNISWADAQKIAKHKLVRTAIPLAYGDSYQNYKIVGSDSQYIAHFGVKIAKGRLFSQDFEVCVGAEIAQKYQLKIGSQFYSTHGTQNAEENEHKANAYTVVGILQPTQSLLNQLVVCNLGSIWRVHQHEGEQAEPPEITAMLLKFKTPMALMQLPRYVNTSTNLQAALPNIEINRLLTLLGVGESALTALAWLIMLVSGISIFIAVFNNVQQRRPELALMRIMGAQPWQLGILVLFEAIFLVVFGYGIGILCSRIALFALAQQVAENFQYQFNSFFMLQPNELILLAACFFVAILAAILPAVLAYFTPIAQAINHE